MPAPGAAAATGSASGNKAGSGIIATYSELSDDGKWALAEFVAADRTALLPILEDTSEGVWAVEKGRVPLQTIEAELRKFKKSIDMRHFGAVVR